MKRKERLEAILAAPDGPEQLAAWQEHRSSMWSMMAVGGGIVLTLPLVELPLFLLVNEKVIGFYSACILGVIGIVLCASAFMTLWWYMPQITGRMLARSVRNDLRLLPAWTLQHPALSKTLLQVLAQTHGEGGAREVQALAEGYTGSISDVLEMHALTGGRAAQA